MIKFYEFIAVILLYIAMGKRSTYSIQSNRPVLWKGPAILKKTRTKIFQYFASDFGRALILAKNESYHARNLAMHASKKWALTLIFVNGTPLIKNNIDNGMEWKSRKGIAQATVKQ